MKKVTEKAAFIADDITKTFFEGDRLLHVEIQQEKAYFKIENELYHRYNMEMTLRMNSKQLNPELLENIQNMFKDKEIEITVTEVDETEYLFRSPENKKRLLYAIDDVENNRNIVLPDQSQFQ